MSLWRFCCLALMMCFYVTQIYIRLCKDPWGACALLQQVLEMPRHEKVLRCQTASSSDVEILNHVVSAQGLQVDPKKSGNF